MVTIKNISKFLVILVLIYCYILLFNDAYNPLKSMLILVGFLSSILAGFWFGLEFGLFIGLVILPLNILLFSSSPNFIVPLLAVSCSVINIIAGYLAGKIKLLKKDYNTEHILEKKFKYLFDANPLPMFIHTSDDFKILEVNQAVLKMYGMKKEEFLFLRMQDLSTNNKFNIDHIHEKKFSIISQHKTSNGKSILVELNPNLIDYDNAKAYLTIALDVTEKLKLENENKMLALSLMSIKECVSVTDHDNNIIFVNDSFCETYGYTRDEVIGKNIIDMRASFSSSSEITEAIKVKTKDGGFEGELYNQKKDGTVFPILLTTSSVKNENNEIIALIGVARDISEIKNAEKKVLDALNKIEIEKTKTDAIIAGLGESLNIIDDQGFITYQNEVSKQFYGPSIGKKCAQIINHSDALCEDCPLVTQNWNDGKVIMEKVVVNGTTKFYEMTLTPLKDNTGKISGAIQLTKDITDLKTVELTLKELNANKDKFFSIIAHDLRSPFNALLGLSEFLKNDCELLSSNEIKEFSSHIHTSARQVYELLENLLQWSRIQTNRIEYKPEILNVKSTVDFIFTLLNNNAALKQIELVNNTSIKHKVFADKNSLNSVLQNLISNAIKFTPNEGFIKVTSYEEGNNIIFCVEDNGIGIKQEDLDKLFRIDIQYSTKGTNDEKGTGLGLVLCKELMKKNNGDIFVESEPGNGSRFYVILPTEK